MKVLLSWLREFVDVRESADEIARVMSVRGFAVEGIERLRGLFARRRDTEGGRLDHRFRGDRQPARLHVGRRHGARDRHGVRPAVDGGSGCAGLRG